MIEIKSFLAQTLFKSSLPLLIGGTYHLLKELFSRLFLERSHNDSLMDMTVQDSGSERVTFDYLNWLNGISFGVYTNMLAFLVMMVLSDLFYKIVKSGIRNSWREVKSFRRSGDNHADDDSEKEWRLFDLVPESQIIRIFSYIVIFILIQIVWSPSEILPKNHHYQPVFLTQSVEKSSHMQTMLKHDNDFRTLEEEEEEMSPSSIMTSDKISLSMGNILSSLSLRVNAMILSKDKKIAFATLDYYGTLQIIDISDLKSPFVLGSLNLEISTYLCRIKSLALSSDEKTLYLSNSKDLEIVDITDLTSPKLISKRKSEIFGLDVSSGETPPYFKTSLAISESTKTLYIGGLGLQVYDISDPKKPVLLKAFKNDKSPIYRELTRNEICLSRDGKVLFIANGTLDVYNISDPKGMSLMYSFPTESSPRAILLSEDFKTAFLLGTSERTHEIIFEEMDVSNYDSLKIKNTIHLGYKSNHSPRFLAVSPSKSKFFIFADSDYKGFGADGIDLLIFDRMKQKTIRNEKSLVEDTFTMDFSQDGKTLITSSNGAFMTIELFLEYPNKNIFSLSQKNLIDKISLPSDVTNMKMSDNRQYLFILRKENNSQLNSDNIFEILDLKNPIKPTVLDSFNCSLHIKQMHFTKDENTVYLRSDNFILILDITNRSSISIKKTYTVPKEDPKLEYFVASADEKTGFLIRNQNQVGYVSLFDLSKPSGTIEDLVKLPMKSGTYNSRLILFDNDKTLMVLSKEFTIYNTSDLATPTLIASMPFGINEPNPYLNSHFLSSDKKLLFLETAEQTGFQKLRIYNISVPTSPQVISEKYFSKDEDVLLKPAFSLLPNLRTGFVFQENSLIKLDMVNLKQPNILGMIQLTRNENEEASEYAVNPDGEIVYAVIRNEIRILQANPQYTLFLKQEKFSLGEKYSDNVGILNLTGGEYNLVDTESYRVIKLSLLEIRVVPNRDSLDIITSALPSWMTFDRESNILMVEPKKQRDIGTYTLKSTFSLKIPRAVFDGIGTAEDPISSEDLVAWLISLDYVDPQLYLTANFRSFDTFYLPSNFSRYRKTIYNLLKKYHVETCTLFEIASSLRSEETHKNAVAIETLSPNSIKVDIKLEPRNGSEAKFVNRPYGQLIPVIKENKTKISLEGNLKEINTALNSLVVNFENGTLCNANVVINDGLNPQVSTGFNNISRLVRANKPPYLNHKAESTIQEQIDGANIQTGVYFTLTLSDDIFLDNFAEALNYEIQVANNDTAFPDWLSLNGMTLKGTPPEEIIGRDVEMILIAKNEFKQYGVPFKLHIKISLVFWLKLVMKCSPYVLTLIGLFVSANKIFNILRKGIYKHLKEFYVGVGEEISANMIFPISFIKEEQRQSQLVLKKLGKMGVVDFIDQERQAVGKEKVISAIKEAIHTMPSDMKKQITLYPSPIIDQIIMNKFIWMQLDSESERKTKSLFKELEPYCLEVVQRDSSGFVINHNKLNRSIRRVKMSPIERNESFGLEESLISHQLDVPEGVNIHLLKDAILAFAFENHSIDISPIDVDVGVKQKVPANALFRFLKFDLRDIFLNDRNKINYGLNYQIIGDKLCLYGIAQDNLKGKTLVIQIKNLKHKIMKELWIHGVSGGLQKDEIFTIKDEAEARGQGYEIY